MNKFFKQHLELFKQPNSPKST